MSTDDRPPLPRPLLASLQPLPHDRMVPASPIGPDCRDGKCKACAGQALDEVTDQVVQCRCPRCRHRD